VIGGLSLANTVAAAVFERIRDFGVKRALGATDWQLGREILAEALAVTLSGGALGVLLAMVLGLGIDGWARRSGQQAVPLLARPAGRRALLFGAARRCGRRLRGAAHRAPVARGGDPEGQCRLNRSSTRASRQALRGAERPPIEVLAGAELTVQRGELVVIEGPSGSGKSTLLNVLGLLEDADAGEVRFGERTVSALGRVAKSRERGRWLGFRLSVVPAASLTHRARQRPAGRALYDRRRRRAAPPRDDPARAVRRGGAA